MNISFEYPPNYAAIEKRFRLDYLKLKPFFAYGIHIYNPHRVQIPLELLEHERVHSARQGENPAGWWEHYIADDNFRLIEELAAHVIEYKVLVEHHGQTRDSRRRLFHYVATRLRSPMYGYHPPLPYDRAREFLKKAIKEAERPPLTPQGSTAVSPNASPTAP